MVGALGNDNCDRCPLVDLKKQALSISKMLANVKISKISRKANMVAHKLAKFSFINRCDGALINSVPACVADAVMNDCMNILFLINIWAGFFKKKKYYSHFMKTK